MYSTCLLIWGVCLGFLLAQIEISSVIQDVTGEEANYSDSGPVVLDTGQVSMMNKIYEERNDEYGFCFNRRGENQSIDLRHPSSVDYSNSTYIEWSCPTGYEGIIHTHPGEDAAAELSEMDKETLVNSTYQVSCVMADTIPVDRIEELEDFSCFNDPVPEQDSFESEEELEEVLDTSVFDRVEVRVRASD